MAITDSWGYAGDIDAPEWARVIPLAGGSDYGVFSYSDWRPTIGGAGDRAVTVAAGLGWGHGVMDTNGAPVTLNLASVVSGSRWDLIVARRVWSTNTTSFQVVTGGTAQSIPTRLTVPGTNDEQPIALARVQSGSTTVAQLIDLRCIPGNSGLVAFNDLALSYLTRVGTQVRIGGTLWQRIVNTLGSVVWSTLPVGDTGWVDITSYSAGMSSFRGSRYRIQNGLITLHVSAQGTIPTGGYTALFPTPLAIRPLATAPVTFGGIGSGGHALGFSWENGSVVVGNQTGSGRVWASGTVTVPAGAPFFA